MSLHRYRWYKPNRKERKRRFKKKLRRHNQAKLTRQLAPKEEV
jgi:hypothetical protein